MTDLEQKAREAAKKLWIGRDPFPVMARSAFVDGYLAAAKEAEQEIAALRARVAELEEYLRLDSQELEDELGGFYLSAHHSERWYELRTRLRRTKLIPVPEETEGA